MSGMTKIGTVIALLALGANGGPPLAQIVPAVPYYALPPASPPASYSQSPVQQQVLQDYHSQLQATQRDLLQQNPSGLGREQLDIAHQLNALDLPGSAPPAAGGQPR